MTCGALSAVSMQARQVDACNLTILCLAGVMAEKTQLLAQHLAINSVIIHHQHLQPIPRPCLGQDWHVAYINVFKDLQTHFDINPGSTPQIAGQQFQFRDIRPKAASEIEDISQASRLLGHSTQEITKRVYRRVGKVVSPSK
ncbi:hypothetical protein PS652_02637 [Pseudomonas fluorescens]|uniref:Integrase n=1 Tax=Pseudomonas fluorescens TaxID=294 RepID=A0A5E6TVN6_PSEFL|nr:hypothetical protein PS652_03092 [Pseudomonas fluorescens]